MNSPLDIFSNLSVVLQGGLAPQTAKIIENWRKCAPGCEIILSTWAPNETLGPLVDGYVVNSDPGTFPVMQTGRTLRVENTNRQIVSSIGGLHKASRKIAIKWRTDFNFCPSLMQKFLSKNLPLIGKNGKRELIVFSINSTNPFAGLNLVAQLSDWMYLGRREMLIELLPASPILHTPENTELPSEIDAKRAFPIARFSAEQWMLRDGLNRAYGIALQRFDDAAAIPPYLRLIGSNIAIVNPKTVGLITNKYDHFITPHWRTMRSFIGFRLSTISQFDSILLGTPFMHPIGIAVLKLKGIVFNAYKYVLGMARSQ